MKLLCLIASYISNQKQCVRVDNKRSEMLCVTSGAPEGSIWPPFFILFINDLPTALDENCAFVYLDFKILATNQTMMEEEVTNIEKWCCENYMRLKGKKYAILNFKKPKSASISKIELENVTSLKDLGLVFQNLSWN